MAACLLATVLSAGCQGRRDSPEAVGNLVAMGCIVAAAILCCINRPRTDDLPGVRKRASTAFLAAVVIGPAAGLLGGILSVGSAIPSGWPPSPGIYTVLIFWLIKYIVWIGVLMALIPDAAVDLIIADPPKAT